MRGIYGLSNSITDAAQGRLIKSEDWWAKRKIGEIVHYHHGFGQFIRGEIVMHEGLKQMRCIGIVGCYEAHDLPRYNYRGELLMSMPATMVRNSAIIQPDVGFMVEGTYELRVEKNDPRKKPVIAIVIPQVTPEQTDAARLEAVRTKAIEILQIDQIPPGMSYRDLCRERLKDVQTLLSAAYIADA